MLRNLGYIFKLLSYEKEYCCRKLENEHYSC